MIETSPFGKTGHQSTRILFGAAALGGMKQDKADRVLEVLLEYGINHLDTAASYGESELRIGPWMREHRKRFFLATKTGDRSYQGARDSLHRSLERLRVDQLDLIQMHNLAARTNGKPRWERRRARSTGRGAREGTGAIHRRHRSRLTVAAMHRRSLERFAFDSVLFPIQLHDAEHSAVRRRCRSAAEALQRARRRDADDQVGGAASMAKRRRPKFSWYEPLRDRDAIRRAVHFVLSRPGLFLNSSSDATILRDLLDAASEKPTAPARAEMEADVARYAMEPLFIPGVSDTI